MDSGDSLANNTLTTPEEDVIELLPKEESDDLASFREKWTKELQISKSLPNNQCKLEKKLLRNEDKENIAKGFFIKGIEMEKTGKMYEAIQFYRRAVQLVPDIEFKVEVTPKIIDKETSVKNTEDDLHKISGEKTVNDESDSEVDGENLYLRIQKNFVKQRLICSPKNEQREVHIGQLPMEIILYILRWVVSRDLDLRSLEMFSRVCRGFYLCARDPEIWKLACMRVWNLNCSSSLYSSWREMYIERPRLRFNGCYISKTTYTRPGEHSFQDHLYRPWHLVAYYRYFRFFPEGVVLMLTCAEEPTQAVGQLKMRNARYPVLSGFYRLKDDTVTMVFQRQDKKKNYQNFARGRRIETQESYEQTFHVELKIKNHQQIKHIKLAWNHYSIFTKSPKGDISNCEYDLRAQRFPALWFSRVKSFTAESDCPL